MSPVRMNVFAVGMLRSENNLPAARDLRKRQTAAVEDLWQAIRDRRLLGSNVRRRHPVGRFVLDFYEPALRLVIEIDGGVHRQEDVVAADGGRSALLEAAGSRFLRFPNEAINGDLPGVLAAIDVDAIRIGVERSRRADVA